MLLFVLKISYNNTLPFENLRIWQWLIKLSNIIFTHFLVVRGTDLEEIMNMLAISKHICSVIPNTFYYQYAPLSLNTANTQLNSGC